MTASPGEQSTLSAGNSNCLPAELIMGERCNKFKEALQSPAVLWTTTGRLPLLDWKAWQLGNIW